MVVVMLAPGAALAQTTNCTTRDFGPGYLDRYQTTCNSNSSYVSAIVDLATLQYEAQLAAQAQQAYAAQQQAYEAQQQAYAAQVAAYNRQTRINTWGALAC
jgi:hypothetical protein